MYNTYLGWQIGYLDGSRVVESNTFDSGENDVLGWWRDISSSTDSKLHIKEDIYRFRHQDPSDQWSEREQRSFSAWLRGRGRTYTSANNKIPGLQCGMINRAEKLTVGVNIALRRLCFQRLIASFTKKSYNADRLQMTEYAVYNGLSQSRVWPNWLSIE